MGSKKRYSPIKRCCAKNILRGNVGTPRKVGRKQAIDQMEVGITWARFTLRRQTQVYFKVGKAKIGHRSFRLSELQANWNSAKPSKPRKYAIR